MSKSSFTSKITSSLRIYRAASLVWAASKRWTILSVLLTIVQGILPLAALYIMKLIVDAIAAGVQSGQGLEQLDTILYLVLVMAAVAMVQAAFRGAGEYVTEAQSSVVTEHVSTILHEKSISLDLAYYENPNYCDTLHRAQQEGPYRPIRIVNGLTRLLQSAIGLTAMVGLLMTFHWLAGLFLFISTLPGIAVQVAFARKRFEMQNRRTQDERRANYFSYIMTSADFAKELRLFGLGRYFSDRYDATRRAIRGEKLSISQKKAFADSFAQFFAVAILMGCFFVIARHALQGAITLGDAVMFIQAFQRGVTSLKELLADLASLHEDNLFVSHFFHFLELESQVTDPARPTQLPMDDRAEVCLENIHFSYPGSRAPVLAGVNMTIKPGEVVALVGANGAGKSTLVKLLCRLYDPTQGRITYNGTDLRDLSTDELHRNISVVFQDYAKYYLSVGDNIALGDSTQLHDFTRIEQAAIKAEADSFIAKLPAGYATQLGRWFDEGEELSIGEWQKIALARAFFRGGQLLILDEPTSSLDVATEYHVHKKFRELIGGRSALIISHRFSTVTMADRMYVLDDKSIVESGTHKELIALNGVYAGMYRKQAAWLMLSKE